jgi:hypothetical protein
MEDARRHVDVFPIVRSLLADIITCHSTTLFRRAILYIFQLSGVMTDTLTRSVGYLSMASAAVSILYSGILVIHFSALRDTISASAEEGGGHIAGENTEDQSRRRADRWITVSVHSFSVRMSAGFMEDN